MRGWFLSWHVRGEEEGIRRGPFRDVDGVREQLEYVWAVARLVDVASILVIHRALKEGEEHVD